MRWRETSSTTCALDPDLDLRSVNAVSLLWVEAVMRVVLTRLDERRYESVVTRDDGVCFRVDGVGHMFAIPHDLAHLAVEETLQLRSGFWGTIADGGVFPSMTYLHGRRKPQAANHSRELLKANKARITEAEMLVSIFNNGFDPGYPEADGLRTRLREYYWAPPGQTHREFTDAEIAAVRAAWGRMLIHWQQLEAGSTLEFTWPDQIAKRGPSPRRGRSV